MGASQMVIIGNAEKRTLRAVTVREITPADVRAWLVKIGDGIDRDPAMAMVWPDFGLDDIAIMCDASVEDLAAYPPSELDTLVVTAKKLNPHFFRPRAKLAEIAREIEAKMLELLQTPSTATASG